MKWAKWILTGLGWAMGGPLGAVAGYFVGRAISDNPRPGQRAVPPRPGQRHVNTGTEQDVTFALIVLMASVMKSDGQVTRSELDYVKTFLRKNYAEDKANDILHALRDVVKRDFELRDICRQIVENTGYSTRYHMLDFLFGLADADATLTAPEATTLRRIGAYLGINTRDYASILGRHLQQGRARQQRAGGAEGPAFAGDPYQVLGITSAATDDEVRRAYRRLALKYHPDKVEGMSEEVRRNATEQFRRITEAYETIKTARNIK